MKFSPNIIKKSSPENAFALFLYQSKLSETMQTQKVYLMIPSWVKAQIAKRSYYLFFLVFFAVISTSCGTSREIPGAPSTRPLSRDERSQYTQRLGMPISGKENPALIREVALWIGTPYRYGGTNRSGVDCSGFIVTVNRNVYGRDLPRTTAGIANATRRVNRRGLRDGDLVFFRTKGRKISHAGIYLGNGYFAHASSSRGVVVDQLSGNYWSRHFVRGGRP